MARQWIYVRLACCVVAAALPGGAAGADAVVRVRADRPAGPPVTKYLTGKFCEHLGDNIYHGMDAQVLRNPTFAEYHFWDGQMTPDGVAAFLSDRQKINRQLRQQARRRGWPEDELDRLVEGREDALACWWVREGSRKSVTPSADTGPHGGRAQRVQVKRAGEGVAQWVYLPLHRARKYEFEVFARSPDDVALAVSLTARNAEEPCARAEVRGVNGKWQTFRGTLVVSADLPAGAPYRLALTAGGPGQFVVGRVLLRPADHVGGADPDVVRLLKQARLPILRWPGGNFVSGYHWEDSVGPIERRPTRPNYAWGGVEPNLFGTDEFIAFCRAVGCEPMICINAGNGTPAEAARWIEYCNGPADSPMGKRRAANGHPEPYRVRFWEVGNELWGRWQYHWTTPAGYVDRYAQFRAAMLAADPTIELSACGAPVLWGAEWNRTLIKGAGATLKTITDHPLIGGDVDRSADPLDVHRDFMALPDVLAAKWQALRKEMEAVGVREPRLAVTELQLFAHLKPQKEGETERLTHENLVNPQTLAEALHDVLVYHQAVRLGPFVSIITHSATVNHGGGLRKEREQVYAHPCYWAQAGFADFLGARPVAVEVDAPQDSAPLVLPELKAATPSVRFAVLDALAARPEGGGLLLSLVHRGTSGPLRVRVDLEGYHAAPEAELQLLSADVPWAMNTRLAPDAVRTRTQAVRVEGGRLTLELRPFTWARVRLAPAGGGRPR